MRTIEEKIKYHLEYYRKNRQKFRDYSNQGYARKTKKKREDRKNIEATLHPLLVSVGHKMKKGTVRHRIRQNYCSPSTIKRFIESGE